VPALKPISAPGGAFIGIDFDSNQLRVVTPMDTAATVAGLTYIYDIFPWRAPRNIPPGSTFPFVLSGANFNNLGRSPSSSMAVSMPGLLCGAGIPWGQRPALAACWDAVTGT
jgi:hypothetical protein